MAYTQTAKGLSALGRKGDDTLLHVSKKELAGLQSLLGPITVNPNTGLPEAFSWTDLLATAGIGLAGALTGGAALAAAPEIGALGATAVGAGVGGLGGGTLSAIQGHGFAPGALGGAISGGIGGFGGAGDFNAAGVAQDSAAKAGLGAPVSDTALMPSTAATGFKLPSSVVNQFTSPAENLTIPTIADTAPASFTMPSSGLPQGVMAPQSFMDKLSTGLSNQAGAMTTKAGLSSLLMPIGTGAGLGTAATDMLIQSRANEEQAKQDQAQANANAQDQQNYFASLGYPINISPDANSKDSATQRNYFLNLINSKRQGMAAGGPVTIQMPMGGTQVSATLPPKYVSEFEKTNVNNEINQAEQALKDPSGFAPGGYINTQPINPENFYPQSQIPSAHPYAATTPQRHEVIHGFENGGMLDGPGDGMSDDIPANIDGKEEVRLADGEFVVPPDLVRILGFGDPEKGAELLDNLLPIVRQASHGKKTQVRQDAGKLAVEKMLDRAVKAKRP